MAYFFEHVTPNIYILYFRKVHALVEELISF